MSASANTAKVSDDDASSVVIVTPAESESGKKEETTAEKQPESPTDKSELKKESDKGMTSEQIATLLSRKDPGPC